MDKDISSITIHSTKKCTYCATPSPLIQFTLILENSLLKIIQSKVGSIFYLPFPDDEVCCLRNVLNEIRSLSFTDYLTFLEYLRQILNKMCGGGGDGDRNNNNKKLSFPYLRKSANLIFETIKIIIERELKNSNLLDVKIPNDVDKSSDVNFRKELIPFPPSNGIITTREQREKYCSNLKVVPVEHKLPDIVQPVAAKIEVQQKQDGNGAKIHISQIPPPNGIPSDILQSVELSDDESKRLAKILSKIPQGESQSYRDYVILDMPSVLSIMDQQNILIRKLVEQNAIIKKSLSKIFDSTKIRVNKQQQQQQHISQTEEEPSPPSLNKDIEIQTEKVIQQQEQEQNEEIESERKIQPPLQQQNEEMEIETEPIIQEKTQSQTLNEEIKYQQSLDPLSSLCQVIETQTKTQQQPAFNHIQNYDDVEIENIPQQPLPASNEEYLKMEEIGEIKHESFSTQSFSSNKSNDNVEKENIKETN